MRIRLILVPYHLGRNGSGPSSGPSRLLAEGADEAMRSAGHEVEVVTVDPGEPFSHEVAGSFAVNRALAEAVREATRATAFPLVVAADCGSAIGTIAGMNGAEIALVWMDAHGDLNTPETTVTGYLDGMGLATAVGRCWATLAASVPGFRPVPEDLAVLAGARDLDPPERDAVEASPLTHVPPGPGFPARVASALRSRRQRARSSLVLVDADVLDPSEGHANAYAVPGGITADELEASLVAAARALPLRGASLTAYDPDFDGDGRVARTLVRGLRALAHEIGAP